MTKDIKDLSQISIKIIKNEEDELVFDIIGIDASLANAFRRIMIAEVLEKCLIY